MKSLKEISKINFVGQETDSNIQLGCMQRIADANELMAKNYQQLIDERDVYKRRYYEYVGIVNQRDKSISNLRGQITKLKNKLKPTT